MWLRSALTAESTNALARSASASVQSPLKIMNQAPLPRIPSSGAGVEVAKAAAGSLLTDPAGRVTLKAIRLLSLAVCALASRYARTPNGGVRKAIRSRPIVTCPPIAERYRKIALIVVGPTGRTPPEPETTRPTASVQARRCSFKLIRPTTADAGCASVDHGPRILASL